jgi:hypothetical protein
MKLATIRCAACGTEQKRSARARWSACPACVRIVEAHLKATVGTRDPSAWVRALNQTFGNREAFVAAQRLSAAA